MAKRILLGLCGIVLAVVLTVATVGCGGTPASSTDKMKGGEKMGGDKMGSDTGKMGGDKMGGDKMGGDKMGGDKMGSDTGKMNDKK